MQIAARDGKHFSPKAENRPGIPVRSSALILSWTNEIQYSELSYALSLAHTGLLRHVYDGNVEFAVVARAVIPAAQYAFGVIGSPVVKIQPVLNEIVGV